MSTNKKYETYNRGIQLYVIWYSVYESVITYSLPLYFLDYWGFFFNLPNSSLILLPSKEASHTYS